MSTISHDPPAAVPEPRRIRTLLVREAWASLAIAVIWLAVLFAVLFGPDLVSTGAASSTVIPSGIALAPFAFLATWVVAKHGLGHRGDDAAGTP